MMLSCKYLAWEEEMMRCKISRTLLSVARMWRRMDASSGLAESASSPSPTMEPVILSSKKRLGRREWKRTSMGVFFSASPSPYSLADRAAARTLAMSSSSLVFRLPPMLARWRDPATGRTPAKAGLPPRTIFSTAAVVSASRAVTSTGSVSGRRRRALSLPSSVTAWSASMSSTRGSSRVCMDFSNRSVMKRIASSVVYNSPASESPAPAGS